LLDINKAWFGG